MAVPLLAEILPVKHTPAKTVQSSTSQPATPQTDAGKGEVQESDKREAGKTEAGKRDGRKPEGDTTEPGKAQTGKGDAGKGEAGKGEAGKGEAGKGEAGKGEAGKGEALKRDPSKPDGAAIRLDEPSEPGRPHLGAAGRGECSWLGQRVVGLLWRDDLDTAFRHLELYDRFGCPGEHLQLSFRCITRQGDIQKNPKLLEPKEVKEVKDAKEPSEQKEQKTFDDFVVACWTDPATPAPQPAAAEKSAPK